MGLGERTGWSASSRGPLAELRPLREAAEGALAAWPSHATEATAPGTRMR